jgi:UDP-N-acetylglucosamine 2-epimerase (non-hydrolysing)
VQIAYIVGARPNFVKIAPVHRALSASLPDARHVLIHTGQHYDDAMSGVFFRELGLPEADYSLGVGSAPHGAQTGMMMERLEPVLVGEQPDLVIVPGDVNSTLAATLVAAKLGLPLAHLEAGLRSFDRTMPEEINRIVADRFSDYLLIHSAEAIDNLRAEGIPDARVHFVGNTMIDTLVALEDRFRSLHVAERLGVEPGSFLLVTLHRPALVDTPLLEAVIACLGKVAKELPVVFPVHPRTRAQLDRAGVAAPGVILCDPLGYLEFLSLEASAAGVLTDSGGVQEETTYLAVRCFTLRDTTERPVTITHGTNKLLGLEPSRILDIPRLLREAAPAPAEPPPLWDGHAAERVAEVLAGAVVEPVAR